MTAVHAHPSTITSAIFLRRAARALSLLAFLPASCMDGADVSLGDMPDSGAPSSCAAGQTTVPTSVSGLLSECVGFGCVATGGLQGCVYHVTSLADSGEGTLRDAAERVEPLWIVFDVAGEIELQSPVQVASNKTIDGRSRAMTLRNYGLAIGVAKSNVVIENIAFRDGVNVDNNDAIQIVSAHTVWIDHCSFSNYTDGLVDITRAATDVTVSWSRFADHDLVMLIGRSPDDVDDVGIRVTAHHNWWNQTGSYAPRARFGKVHTFNNLVDRWRNSASSVTMGGQLFSEANIFVALSDKAALVTSQGADPSPGKARSRSDWLQNDAVVKENEPDAVFNPTGSYPYALDIADADLQTKIMTGAGATR